AKEATKESAEVLELLKKKDEEIVDLMSRLRYAQADFQNLQRISQIEKQKAQTYAISNLAKSLLTTLDNLHMALHAIPESALDPSKAASSSSSAAPAASSKKPDPDFFTSSTHTTLKQLHEGVLLTRNSLMQALKSHGVEPFDAKGEPFDPNYHEALFEIPGKDELEGKVVTVMKHGYKIGDRVLRAAQVGV
ncbi:GrpE nucleotide exchange factor, partial [Calocera viscosa TUFC12733]